MVGVSVEVLDEVLEKLYDVLLDLLAIAEKPDTKQVLNIASRVFSIVKELRRLSTKPKVEQVVKPVESVTISEVLLKLMKPGVRYSVNDLVSMVQEEMRKYGYSVKYSGILIALSRLTKKGKLKRVEIGLYELA
jgi:hypothetical protein